MSAHRTSSTTGSVLVSGAGRWLQSPSARWSAPALGALGAVALGLLWQAVWPPAFTATARIVVDPSAAGASGAAAEWIATQADIIRSDWVARRVVSDLGFAAGLSERNGSAPADQLLAHLTVEPSERGGMITVGYANPDPTVAAQVADAFVAAYDRVSQEMQAVTATAIKERAGARISALRDEVERAQSRVEAVERAQPRDGVPDFAKTVSLARFAPAVAWSGLPGEQRIARSGSVLADPEHTALDGATLERPASGEAAQIARSDLAQASQALLSAQARLAQFDGERMLARPIMSVLGRGVESVKASSLDSRRIAVFAALCGLMAGWVVRATTLRANRRVTGPDDLARIGGLSVLGVLSNAQVRSPRAAREPRRPLAVHGDAIPALP
jgi:hypothetical protein